MVASVTETVVCKVVFEVLGSIVASVTETVVCEVLGLIVASVAVAAG